MGNAVSTPDCFLWAQLPPENFAQVLAEEFTVIRTSGEEQTGWRIPSVSHLCHKGVWQKDHAHIWDQITDGKGEKSWRFHMVRDAPGAPHFCGWRRERSFWPSRLTTQEEKEEWWADLETLLATFKRTRDMTDAELMPLLETQEEREAEVERNWTEEEKAVFKSRRDQAIALTPDMANRYAFWKEVQAELARLKEKLKELAQEAENNPELQKELTAFTSFYGAEDQLADNLQKHMLEQRAEKERQATLKERDRIWRELDAVEQNAVAHKDYKAAERAHSQKKTAQEYWREEDAKKA
jgi:hypothetical protein